MLTARRRAPAVYWVVTMVPSLLAVSVVATRIHHLIASSLNSVLTHSPLMRSFPEYVSVYLPTDSN